MILKKESFSRLSKDITNENLGIIRFDEKNKFIPTDNFILCKDSEGKETAVFGNDIWSFKPISTDPNGANSVLNFELKTRRENDEFNVKDLKSEMKRLITIVIYLVPKSGKYGSITTKTLKKRFSILKEIAYFCIEQTTSNKLLVPLSIESVLSNKNFLTLFTNNLSENKLSELSNLISDLNKINKYNLGFSVVDFYSARPNSNQTPLIPFPIYLNVFTNLHKEIETFWELRFNLKYFISEFVDRNAGKMSSTLKKEKKSHLNEKPLSDLISKHSLTNLFAEKYQVKNKKSLSSAISSIQETCKYFIHMLTGMRSKEVLHMNFDCVSNQTVLTVGETSFQKKIEQTVSIVSSSTKFSGYKKENKWIAPAIVIKAIEVLQNIAIGLAKIFNLDHQSLPLLQSAAIIYNINSKPSKTIQSTDTKILSLENIKITQRDRELLLASDESRDFHEAQFQVGNNWKFSDHQFRRSLAYYGSHSGLISDSVGAKQFKQVTQEMQRYYRSGSSKIQSLIGFYNSEKNKIEVPNDHIAHLYRKGVTNEQSKKIISDLFDVKNNNHGKLGSYTKRIRDNLKDNEAIIITIQKQINDGSISYKETLLGGCASNKKCDDYMLGNFTACINCKSAYISLDKLESAINLCKEALNSYETNSAEYQLSNSELKELEKLKMNFK